MIGMILSNRYEILEKIGEGGMAEVFKARCHKLNRFDAVKILKREFINDSELVEKFKREATAIADLSHNNIINIFDVGTQDNINYIVMEYVKGKTLKQVIVENVRLSYERTMDIGIQIAKALDCAHKKNIIHRDVKPQNILVTDEGVVKVTDFGIAKAPTSVTITNSNKVMGSAHYFSPEQAKGNYVDCRTDIYSLGIVLYEMVTGKVPYDAESPVTVALKHIQEPVVPPIQLNSSIPQSLNKLILKAMEKDPNMRYQTAKDLLNDLIRIQKDVNSDIETKNINDDFTRIMSPVNVKTELEKEATASEEEEDNEEASDGLSSRTKKILIGSLLVVLAIAIGTVAAIFIAPKTPNNPVTTTNTAIKVPNIIGKSTAEAQQMVKSAGLTWQIAQTQNSDKPADTVLSVSPDVGTTVKKNDEVRVTLSSGPEVIKVPDVKGYDKTQAEQIIKDAKMQVGNETPQFSDSVDINSVIDQDPPAGSQGDSTTNVKLVISKGPEYVQVPDLTNMTINQAKNALANNKLALGATNPKPTGDKSKDGLISDQASAPGSKLKPGQTVDVSVYAYTEPKVTVPNFKGMTVKDAKNNSNVTSGDIVLGGIDSAADTDIIQSQDKDANSQVSKGSKVTLTSAPAVTNVTVPNFVGMTVSQAKNDQSVTSGNLILAGIDSALPTDVIGTQAIGSQTVQPNSQVPKGSTITLTLKPKQ